MHTPRPVPASLNLPRRPRGFLAVAPRSAGHSRVPMQTTVPELHGCRLLPCRHARKPIGATAMHDRSCIPISPGHARARLMALATLLPRIEELRAREAIAVLDAVQAAAESEAA